MRYLLILSIFLFSCSKEEEVNFKNTYQLRMDWVNTPGRGTNLWIRVINLNYKTFIYINPIYHKYRFTYVKDNTYDIDVTKLEGTNDIKVILTFDCELGVGIRDMIPDYFDIKEEVLVNFYEDKRTVIEVSPSSDSNCNPDIRVFYE